MSYLNAIAHMFGSKGTRMETIRQAVTEIWVPQVWQPPARPDRDDNAPPAWRAEG